jgi:hemerythrin
MEDERCPDLETRRRTHRQLLDQVREIMEAYENGGASAQARLPGTLKDWLGEAMGVDARLFADINEGRLTRWGLSRSRQQQRRA